MPDARARPFPHVAIATPHYLASAAGLAVFADGGNAVDAIVAANLALGVVVPYRCGYGGDLFAIVFDGELTGYLGSGRAPAKATAASVRQRNGDAMPFLGADTVTVPGAPAGWFALLERWGTRSFGDLAHTALTYARDGFEVTPAAAWEFAAARGLYADFDPWMTAHARVEAGTVLRQPALARTIEALADGGPDAYYRGPIAHAVAGAVQAAGGDLEPADLAAHAGEWTTPLRATYRGLDVAELPPPTQGVAALEALRILDGYAIPPPGAAREHVLIEAVKIALADRDAHVTDPAHMRLAPADLLSDSWIDARRAGIDPDRAVDPGAAAVQRGGTAYLCAADADGMVVSLIQSNFLSFGSGVHVPEWGINLNNRGSSFSLDESAVNAYAPGKRPMHTLVPAMGLRDGAPEIVFGSMGGDAQIQVHVQLLTHLLDGVDPGLALAAPRWRVDPGRWRVHLESRFDESLAEGLQARGHPTRAAPDWDNAMGHAHVIVRRDHGGYLAASDPRSEGAALGL
jgi:gamma-glutamyltranspeptidase / glutathione hydrolase